MCCCDLVSEFSAFKHASTIAEEHVAASNLGCMVRYPACMAHTAGPCLQHAILNMWMPYMARDRADTLRAINMLMNANGTTIPRC